MRLSHTVSTHCAATTSGRGDGGEGGGSSGSGARHDPGTEYRADSEDTEEADMENDEVKT